MSTDGVTGQQAVLNDYAPFGEGLTNGTNGRDARWGSWGPGLHFTGKEQEGAEGDYMDYFGARYYSGGQGRFSSPDQVGNFVADRRNPQSWHLYSYVWNNPLALIDPSGLCSQSAAGYFDDNKHGKILFDGPCSAGQIGGTAAQQVDVNAQQGSLWALLLAPQIPRYVPYDKPLDERGQIVVRELGKRIDAYPTICGGGFYFYAGRELEAGPVSGFAGVITEFDSRTGASKGALFEGGVGEGIVGGVGYIGSTTGGQAQATGLAYLGLGVKSNLLSGSVGGVGFGSEGKIGGVGIFGEGFLTGRGGGFGAYTSISSIGGCR